MSYHPQHRIGSRGATSILSDLAVEWLGSDYPAGEITQLIDDSVGRCGRTFDDAASIFGAFADSFAGHDETAYDSPRTGEGEFIPHLTHCTARDYRNAERDRAITPNRQRYLDTLAEQKSAKEPQAKTRRPKTLALVRHWYALRAQKEAEQEWERGRPARELERKQFVEAHARDRAKREAERSALYPPPPDAPRFVEMRAEAREQVRKIQEREQIRSELGTVA
jgi:hypothetical protein